MKKMNKKGFTLIELLAVIVILAVLLAIAVPAVSGYITTSKKNGYIDTVLQYIDAARKAATLGVEYNFPADRYTSTVIGFDTIVEQLDKGGTKSSYGNEWDADYSYVVIVNEGTNETPKYVYYVAAYDGKYAIGYAPENGTASAQLVREQDLNTADVVRVSTALAKPTDATKFNITEGATTNAGTQLVVNASGVISVDSVN